MSGMGNSFPQFIRLFPFYFKITNAGEFFFPFLDNLHKAYFIHVIADISCNL